MILLGRGCSRIASDGSGLLHIPASIQGGVPSISMRRCFPDMHEPPALIQGEPALLQAWQFGYDLAEEAAEMAECSSCQDGTGNPCPFHG